MVPLTVLNECKNKTIEVHTSDQDVYTGVLYDFDIYVNISLRNAEYHELGAKSRELIGDTIIQGNFVTFVKII
ncbi:uncharacterized protein VICG_01484 [Vittaforma corneae ATCC 50505]|uniref:Sm domain-containing protein n=1 Tax=Vittaforma corneae (strain ATCC 50505) TaxID=993615 RepID=L2GLX2_VITCO|nr:uncharacterized protein VICG_01484 [Vittaforma corneae ATCC 50505]ELA41500.1 hypothetical protein VICG_01484 [Vittaforma corneae ATCC 50505]